MSATGEPPRNLLDLSATAWAELGDACVLLPLGSTEQHGSHLPMGTDTHIANAICEAASKRSSKLVVAPPVPFGVSHHHRSIRGGAISLTPRLLADYLVAVLAEIVHGDRSAVVVNGHGGNWSAITCAIDELGATLGEMPAVACSWWHLVPELIAERTDIPDAAVGHGGAIETSVMLAHTPATVSTDAVPGGATTIPGADEFEATAPARFYKWRDFGRYSPDGVFGRPDEADEDLGHRLIELAAERLVSLADIVRSRAGD
jgi:creatinine amidohydrolase